MKEDVRKKIVAEVKAMGETIIQEAENIVGDFEYGQGLKIECEIDVDMLPTIKAERQFISTKMLDVRRNG